MSTQQPGIWEPRSPESGDFRFVECNGDRFDPSEWPADPRKYRATQHFTQRFRRYERAFQGKDIREAISSGNLVPALGDCAAFYTTRPGVVIYIVVGWDRSSPSASNDRVVVTGWPYVFDREEALESGTWATTTLNRIQHLNGTLMNEETADEFWLDYLGAATSR